MLKYQGKGFISDKSAVNLKDFDTKRLYKVWLSVLQRSFNEKLKSRDTCYHDVGVSEDFLDFNFFLTWATNQVGYNNNGWQLDKDILVKGNKIYSPETCCFVPREINNNFIRCMKKDKLLPMGITKQRNGKYRVRLNWEGEEKLVGVFKDLEDATLAHSEAKSSYVKSLAEKWKGKIDDRVYDRMVTYN